MAKNSVSGVKENPKLCKRALSDGRISLHLSYYLGYQKSPKLDNDGNQVFKDGKPLFTITHERRKRELKLYLLQKPKTPEEREANRETLLLAQRIRGEEEQALLNDTMGYRLDTFKSANFLAFFEAYINDYTKADIRNVRSAFEYEGRSGQLSRFGY